MAEMNSRLRLVIAVLYTMGVCSAHYEDKFAPKVYCGRVLARAIANICYEEGAYDKRSELGTMYNSILAPYYKEQEAYNSNNEVQPNWPWLAPHKAKGMVGHARGKRQVADECCNKACTLNELMSYC